MAARLIRDGLLDSEAVNSLPYEGRWLYLAICLTADDIGLFEATAFKLHRKSGLDAKHVSKMLPLLADADLIRLYESDGKTFGFIPKFGQRLQIKRAKYPLPPIALLQGDDEAIKKINNLTCNPTVDSRDPPETTDDHRVPPPEPEPEPEVIPLTTGSLRSPVVVPEADAPVTTKVPPKADPEKPWIAVSERCPHQKLVRLYHELLPTLNAVSSWDERRQAYSRGRWREEAIKNEWATEEDGLKHFAKFFRWVAQRNPHLMGKSPPKTPDAPPFQADLEWLLRPTNYRKVVEGRYEK